MNHTPGKWIVMNNAVYGAVEPQSHSPIYRKLIRPAIQTGRQAAEYGGTLAEQTANAQLIASAPELLDALKSITNQFAWLDANERVLANVPERERIDTLIIKARAAIYNAEESE